MSPEDAFRRVLAARLPAGPGWTAWIDGTVQELVAAVGVTLAPEEAELARIALNRWAYDDEGRRTDLRALAVRLEAS